jgi:hypothetical protein
MHLEQRGTAESRQPARSIHTNTQERLNGTLLPAMRDRLVHFAHTAVFFFMSCAYLHHHLRLGRRDILSNERDLCPKICLLSLLGLFPVHQRRARGLKKNTRLEMVQIEQKIVFFYSLAGMEYFVGVSVFYFGHK